MASNLEVVDSRPFGGGRLTVYKIDRQTTVSSATTLAAAIPIPTNSSYFIEVLLNCYRTDSTSVNSGYIRAEFIRAAGNVSRDGAQSKTQIGGLSGASLDLTANTSTQTADVNISGTSASVTWDMEIRVLSNA